MARDEAGFVEKGQIITFISTSVPCVYYWRQLLYQRIHFAFSRCFVIHDASMNLSIYFLCLRWCSGPHLPREGLLFKTAISPIYVVFPLLKAEQNNILIITEHLIYILYKAVSTVHYAFFFFFNSCTSVWSLLKAGTHIYFF